MIVVTLRSIDWRSILLRDFGEAYRKSCEVWLTEC